MILSRSSRWVLESCLGVDAVAAVFCPSKYAADGSGCSFPAAVECRRVLHRLIRLAADRTHSLIVEKIVVGRELDFLVSFSLRHLRPFPFLPVGSESPRSARALGAGGLLVSLYLRAVLVCWDVCEFQAAWRSAASWSLRSAESSVLSLLSLLTFVSSPEIETTIAASQSAQGNRRHQSSPAVISDQASSSHSAVSSPASPPSPQSTRNLAESALEGLRRNLARGSRSSLDLVRGGHQTSRSLSLSGREESTKALVDELKAKPEPGVNSMLALATSVPLPPDAQSETNYPPVPYPPLPTEETGGSHKAVQPPDHIPSSADRTSAEPSVVEPIAAAAPAQLLSDEPASSSFAVVSDSSESPSDSIDLSSADQVTTTQSSIEPPPPPSKSPQTSRSSLDKPSLPESPDEALLDSDAEKSQRKDAQFAGMQRHPLYFTSKLIPLLNIAQRSRLHTSDCKLRKLQWTRSYAN
jgi:hypothetical protein